MEPEEDLDPPQDVAIVQPRELWDKKPDESQRAFAAFAQFRDAEKRSLKAIADSLNCSVQNVFWWSTRHNWRLRCDAYDLHVSREQNAEFSRSRVRMRERHQRLAVAMGNIAAHGIREWQTKIASGAELNLAPEQVALLVKCSAELERSTIGVDGEQRPPVINILFGVHKYADEKAGDGPEVEGEIEWIPQEDVERKEYESLNPEERAGWETWKNPPKSKQID
jgi:hypothetical protein